MPQPKVYEGTGEELEHYLKEAPKERFRLVALSNEEDNGDDAKPNRVGLDQTMAPNEGMLEVMRQIAERQKRRPYSNGADSLRLLREARAGAMYGYDPADDK